MMRLSRSSTLFPYTTLFRSVDGRREIAKRRFDLLTRYLGAELYGNGFEMPVANIHPVRHCADPNRRVDEFAVTPLSDRKSTRLNSSHLGISYAVFCLKKKKN